jgi:hypothetical protein
VASAPVVDPFDPVGDGELSGRAAGPQIAVVELDFQVAQKDSAAALSQHTPVRPTERARLCWLANRASCAEVTAAVSVQDDLPGQLAAHRHRHP